MKKVQTYLNADTLHLVDELVTSGQYDSRSEAVRESIINELRYEKKLLPSVTVELLNQRKKRDQRAIKRACPLCGHRMAPFETHRLDQIVFNDDAELERYCCCPECGYIWKQ